MTESIKKPHCRQRRLLMRWWLRAFISITSPPTSIHELLQPHPVSVLRERESVVFRECYFFFFSFSFGKKKRQNYNNKQ